MMECGRPSRHHAPDGAIGSQQMILPYNPGKVLGRSRSASGRGTSAAKPWNLNRSAHTQLIPSQNFTMPERFQLLLTLCDAGKSGPMCWLCVALALMAVLGGRRSSARELVASAAQHLPAGDRARSRDRAAVIVSLHRPHSRAHIGHKAGTGTAECIDEIARSGFARRDMGPPPCIIPTQL